MRHKILVIDDSYEERSAVYEQLGIACADPAFATPPSFGIEIIPARHPSEVESLLRLNSFSAVVLDVVLKNWSGASGLPVRASDMLAKLDDSIPVALLSSEWVSDEVKNLVATWPTKNCRMFIHWDDISDEAHIKDGSLTRVVCELAKYIEAHKNIDYSIELEEGSPIRILHLSDLQFGGFKNSKLKLDAPHCATVIRRKWKNGPTFIVITGDIAEHGFPAEYDDAYIWLSELASEFGWSLPSGRILLVPGNHDVCLPFAAASMLALQETDASKKARTQDNKLKKELRINFTADEKLVSDLSGYALRPYLDFCTRLAPRHFLPLPEDPDRKNVARHSYAWVEARFRHYGVVFFGLNTAQPINSRAVPDSSVPKPTVESLAQEMKQIAKDLPSHPMIIGLTHHYPLSGKKGEAVDEPEHFAQLFTDTPRIALWLHGHWHNRETTPHGVPGNHMLIVNSAPSLTVDETRRPPDTSRGFSMIELERSKNKISGCNIYPVEWSGHNGLVIREAEGRMFEIDACGYLSPKP